jgi:hypothetical protein
MDVIMLDEEYKLLESYHYVFFSILVSPVSQVAMLYEQYVL